jgi:hypothetical protein
VENLTTIISSGVFSAALSGVLIFLCRNWIGERIKGAIQHEYDQKLETHKAQLQSRNDIEIAKLKADLEIAAAERNLRLTKTFDKTLEVIAETYRILLELKTAAELVHDKFRSEDKVPEEILQNYRDKGRQFVEYFLPHKIYLPSGTAEQVRRFSNAISSFVMHSSILSAQLRTHLADEEVLLRQSDRVDKVSENITGLLAALETDFRRLLGLAIEDKPAAKTEP